MKKAMVQVGKDGLSIMRSKKDEKRIFPLILTPSRSNMLDDILRGKVTNSPGNLTFRFAYQFDQVSKTITQSQALLEWHQPLSSEGIKPDEEAAVTSPYLNRLIGIDLGERGIGFSVRNLDDHALVERGTVTIPAIRKLMKTVHQHRKYNQARLHVRAASVDFSEMRQSVAGQVISVIKYLMHHYKALPVLEQDLSNLESGAAQLKLVYKGVIDTFCFSGVKTVNGKREHAWRGRKIEHPHYAQIDKQGEVRPFNLFPGTFVRAHGTSQECSGCGVNATQIVRKADQASFAVKPGGLVTVNPVKGVSEHPITLRLYHVGSLKADLHGKRYPEPLEATTLTRQELLTQIKRQRRIAPAFESKDTSQSIYCCPNADCKHSQMEHLLHADMNAADVIVMRKIKRLLPVPADC
ncbi:hypothetical protein [Marinospirillum sp.]|uniref:hypothetical protein n=1 Tax=Marinospirillum sp. TaxID=2183934 RepID=UPI0025B9AC08|nr:hypothetical protein [Marinospirillum sp.]